MNLKTTPFQYIISFSQSSFMTNAYCINNSIKLLRGLPNLDLQSSIHSFQYKHKKKPQQEMMSKRIQETQQYNTGQTLVTLLIFVAFAIVVTTTSVAIIISNTQSTTTLSKGETAHLIAESGVENAILRVLRDRSYTGESLDINGGTAEITVSGSSLIDITSVGSFQDFSRTIHTQTQFNQGVLEVVTWEEQ